MYKDLEQIDQCLGCSKAIIQTKGKRRRLWCSDACRVAANRRSMPNTNNEQTITEQPITNKPQPERTEHGFIRVSKPGDADYVPQCETIMAFVDNRPKRPSTAERGKDIKCFADLPPDVQGTINRMSTNDGKVNEQEQHRRTAIAIHYQHVFPDRYHSIGWAGNVPIGQAQTTEVGEAR